MVSFIPIHLQKVLLRGLVKLDLNVIQAQGIATNTHPNGTFHIFLVRRTGHK